MTTRLVVPDHRYRVAQKCASDQLPSEVETAALALVLRQQASPVDGVGHAYDLYQDTFSRDLLDLALVARATVPDLAMLFEITEDVAKMYQHLFFDTLVFRDYFDRHKYIATRTWGKDAQGLLFPALQQGVDYLKWHFHKNTEIDPRKVMQAAMADSYFRGLMHRRDDMPAKERREALRYLHDAARLAEQFKKHNPTDDADAADQFKILLRHADSTTPRTAVVSEDGAPEPIIH